jgi:hypothetical protein
MDSAAIAAAIALRFAATNVTQPTGAEDVKVSTADLPDALSVFPTVLVMPPTMDNASYNASRSRSYDLTYPTILYLARSDGSPRRAKALHDWATAIYGQLGGQMQLGLSSYVSLCYIVGFTAGTMSFAGDDYDGIRFDVLVRINESYVPVA